MSMIALVGEQYAHHVKMEVLLSYIVLPILGVMMEAEYHGLGFGGYACLLTLNAFLYHVFAGKLTSGSLRAALFFAAGSFIVEQYLGLFLHVANFLSFMLHV